MARASRSRRESASRYLTSIVLFGTLFGVLVGTADRASAQASVPLDVSGRRTMIEATVNGEGPFTFVISSTFTGAQIDRPLAVELGLIGESAADSEDRPDVRLDRLQIGNLTLDDVAARVEEKEPSFLGKSPRGTLGLELFTGYLVTFDLPRGEFRLESGSLPETDGSEVVSYVKQALDDDDDPELMPAVPARIAGKEVLLGLHTGLMGSLQLNTRSIEELELAGETGRIGYVQTDKARAELLGGTVIGTLEIGGHTVSNPPAFFSDLHALPALGSGGLEDFSLTVDQANERLRLSRDESRIAEIFNAAARLQDMLGEEADLRAAFNEHPERVRMILILSPT